MSRTLTDPSSRNLWNTLSEGRPDPGSFLQAWPLAVICGALAVEGAGHQDEAVRKERTTSLSLESLDDVRAARRGDLDAAARLIERYRRRMASYAYAIVLNASDLDDVTQLIFVKMCSRFSSLRDPERFEPWLYQLARRVSLDFLRRNKFKKWWCTLEALVQRAEEAKAPPEICGVGIEEVERALSELNSRDRQIIVLASEGHSYEEIAQLLGASRGAIKARLGRVREYLRSQLM